MGPHLADLGQVAVGHLIDAAVEGMAAVEPARLKSE